MASRFWMLLPLCFLLIAASPSPSVKGPVTVNIDVPARKWKAMRIQNLPKNAVVGVEVRASGEVSVAFVSASDYRRLPRISRPLFQARVDKKLAFSVTIPAPGHYFVVLVNSSSTEARAVTVTVAAARGRQESLSGKGESALLEEPDDLAKAEAKLGRFEARLRQIFVFEPFPIRAEQCGTAKPPNDRGEIILCREYAQALHAVFKDQAKASNVFAFTLFHEVSHLLLKQWDFPFYDDEEMADEFAAATMIMLGQQQRVTAVAEYMIRDPSAAEGVATTLADNRHVISVARARELLRLLKDPGLVRKWQPVFLPHMQTDLLERLRNQPKGWTDLELVKKELAARRGSSAPPEAN